jgi:hypothetical protein
MTSEAEEARMFGWLLWAMTRSDMRLVILLSVAAGILKALFRHPDRGGR